MKAIFDIRGTGYEASLADGHPLSVPMIFNGEQPNTYGVPKARASAYSDGTFTGDTRKGGSCNFETYSLTPHCNGTHTECVGHILDERVPISRFAPNALLPCSLISVRPVRAAETDEAYIPALNPDDLVITREMLEDAPMKMNFVRALCVRTIPNAEAKRYRNYSEHTPAFFTNDAMRLINEIGTEHLLVDFPSVDRLFDDGRLSNHHIFWNVEPGSHESSEPYSRKTITEFIYAGNEINDGQYLLDLQIADWMSDAAPSRPLLYKIRKL